jgi:hypothetical protein
MPHFAAPLFFPVLSHTPLRSPRARNLETFRSLSSCQLVAEQSQINPAAITSGIAIHSSAILPSLSVLDGQSFPYIHYFSPRFATSDSDDQITTAAKKQPKEPPSVRLGKRREDASCATQPKDLSSRRLGTENHHARHF